MGSALQSSSMKVVAALTVLSLLAAPAMSKNLGSINVKDYGEVYVCAPDWASGAIQMHDNGFTMNGNSRLYFCSSPVDGWDPNAYWQTPLNNKHFAYTLHTCNGGNGYWDSCDRGGCQVNAFNVDSNMMCPEDRCTINTNQPFVISHYQNSGTANTWMGQNGQDASFGMCNDGGYISNMANSYGGMVFSASLWGGGGIDMGWLDGMTGCGGECNIDGSSVPFTNFELWE